MTNSSLKIFFLAIFLFSSLALKAQAQSTSDSIPFNSVPGYDDHPASSEATAYLWAFGGGVLLPVLGGTLFGYGEEKNNDDLWDAGAFLLTAGLFVGPSLGQFYAGSPGQAAIGILGRGVGAGLMFAGLLQSLDKTFCGGDEEDDPRDQSCDDQSDGSPLIILGSLVFLASDVYSLIDTHYAVQRANEKSTPPHFGFAPELFRSSKGGLKPGVMAWAKF